MTEQTTPTKGPDLLFLADEPVDEMEPTIDLEKQARWKTMARVFWIGWILMGIVGEVVFIVVAQPGDTLSEQVWSLLAWMDEQRWGAFGIAGFSMLLIGFFGWLIIHFLQKLIMKGRV